MTEYEMVKEKDKEIERLNNIINKLEKYLKERSDLDYEGSITILHERLAMNMTLEYLQELKEK